jgi:predicted DNA-binding antitoxin AbrB/MazE fold protein
MQKAQVEAVYENGVFRPLQPVSLAEHQRVTVVLPVAEAATTNGRPADADPLDEAVGYEPLPLLHCKTIRVRLKEIGELPPLPYDIPADDAEEA